MNTLLPSVYGYYGTNNNNINNSELIGLSDNDKDHFTLNGKPIRILSGALHYFRVPQRYWRDRIRKIRAAGLNCVETYIPWNAHEPRKGLFDFGNGDYVSDLSPFLCLEKFLEIIQEEDLLAIVRPGPYICAEWEFGGLPSWLLGIEYPSAISVRTSDPLFMKHVRDYFGVLLPILAKKQFTKGGPIIAFQIENEYGNTKIEGEPVDQMYLENIRSLMQSYGLVELFFTSDTPSNGFSGTLTDVLATANFQTNAVEELKLLRKHQPYKPLMVMEYWTGWFDHWYEPHQTRNVSMFKNELEQILKMGASVNFYMFHGGTNWGFYNGANISDTTTDNSAYQPDTTSYDYDAPLSESGHYTEKYKIVAELTEKYSLVKFCRPSLPPESVIVQYDPIRVLEYLPLEKFVHDKLVKSQKPLPMERLPINNGSGQSYGYILYRTTVDIRPQSTITITKHVRDTVLVLLNGVLQNETPFGIEALNGFGYWKLCGSRISLKNSSTIQNAKLELLVENCGRANYGKLYQFDQYKGIYDQEILLNGKVLESWEILPLEFDHTWFEKQVNWLRVDGNLVNGPTLFKSVLHIVGNDNIKDTFIYTNNWTRGFIAVNGFVLSRYCNLGPQMTAYLPGSLLKPGDNTIIIFEHFVGQNEIHFESKHIYTVK